MRPSSVMPWMLLPPNSFPDMAKHYSKTTPEHKASLKAKGKPGGVPLPEPVAVINPVPDPDGEDALRGAGSQTSQTEESGPCERSSGGIVSNPPDEIAPEKEIAAPGEIPDGNSPPEENQPPQASGRTPGDLSRIAPRATPGDAFETNPLSAIRDAGADGTARHGMDDSDRVREALHSVIEEGDSVKEAAREWNVAPSAIAEWRERYHDLLKEEAGPETPLLDIGDRHLADTAYIPAAAREIFMENWERLVTETAATPSDFVQSPRQIFLQTSVLTSWLFHEGRVDRGILSGAVSGLIGLAIIASFLIAGRNVPVEIAPPEPAPRDDLVIEEAAVVAQSFFKAPNWEERLKFVRQPDAVRSMMQAYYQDHPDGPINDAALSLAMPVRHLVNLNFEIPSLNRSHFLCVVLSKGRHLVDWESSSLYQEEQINRLRASRSTEPTRIAVTVTKIDANYYNYAFRDDSRWQCYQLGYPGLNLNLFGYALRESGDDIALGAMLGIVDKQAAVLEVRFPPEAQTDNQVEIISVLRGEWVPSDP